MSLTNIGSDDLKGPLMLLLDPGRYFNDAIANAQAGDGDQADLWVLDLSAGLVALGGKLAVGATLANQTVSIVNAGLFATRAGMADLVKANLGHGVYAAAQDNLPPTLGIAGETDTDQLPQATAGQPWSAQIEAIDADGARFYWQLVDAPAGVSLTPATEVSSAEDGYHQSATLSFTPTANADANTQILVRVQDSRGGVALRRFQLAVAGGNHAPVLDGGYDITLAEGESLSLPLTAADADGDRLTLALRNLPPGAVFDAATGMLSWTPGYDQAGVYRDITVIASGGKSTARQRFTVTVEQGYARPVLNPIPAQSLREGEAYALQLAGFVPGMQSTSTQADGTTLTLAYAAPWLPGGATLNAETGWLAWTPAYDQHGTYTVPLSLTATWTTLAGEVTQTSVTRNITFNVANANGAPIFAPAESWTILEGQPLRISVFAFDPDNPGFEPKIRLRPDAEATGPEGTAPTVSYQVDGLPEGATFDAETLEIVWTPGYLQAGTYSITVTATDDGDSTGTPAVSQLVLPIVVNNANRAPQIGDISNAFVDKGGVIEIPIVAGDVDGNPVELAFSGLPRFVTYTQNPSADPSQISGTLRFTPGAGDRGDYTISVSARDNGDGDINQALAQVKRFVLTVRSVSEAPVITAPRQVVALIGQPLSIAIQASDLDQDTLAWTTEGLPLGAVLTPAAQYGHATLTFTPTAEDIGAHDIDLIVSDQGLPPQDAGHVNPDNPVPNITRHALRIVVRAANAAPELLGVQVNGMLLQNTDAPLAVNATEGVPLSLDLFGLDSDTDLIDWRVDGLPRGMTFTPSGNQLSLTWTPDRFAAQDANTDQPGLWRVTVTGSDGMAQFTRSVDLTVANVNQTPRILPMPLQLINEGETLGFTLRAADADNDAIQLALLHDQNTPVGVFFDANSGYFEWTPGQDVVNNAAAASTPYTFTFQASDGQSVSTQTVQVRVFDLNRVPQITATNHAVVIGNTLSIPVGEGIDTTTGITVSDPDGAAQTQALTISFANLPEGAVYDAQTKRLTWTPGPGQIGDTVVTAKAFDGKNTSSRTFTLRTVAALEDNAPKIVVSTTPALPALPGQLVIASVRADAWSGIASLAVELRKGENAPWQPIALDAAGRYRFTPDTPGLIDIRVTATDRDGFTAVATHTVRVKDPADTSAPQLAWAGVLAGSSAASEPITLHALSELHAQLTEAQLMGWRIEIAAAGIDTWQTLASADTPAVALNQALELASLDPKNFVNGVYQLRLAAWDLAGRTTQIDARLIVDSAEKIPPQAIVSDASYTLGGHDLALTRVLATKASTAGDFGNWRLPLLDTGLTSDQPATLASGATAPWNEGARVWLTVPGSLASANAGTLQLAFTLGTTSEHLGSEAYAPQVWHPVFTPSQGWTLAAQASEGTERPDTLTRQGSHLYDQLTGLPWVPAAYTLIAPTGERYNLDAQGRVQRIDFADGAQWFVSDAGLVAMAANGTPAERLDFIRDAQGRIARIAGVQQGQSKAQSTVYRYDEKDRLVLVRELNATDNGMPYGYAANGQLLTDALTANLGTPANWLTGSGAWSGELTGQAVLGFTIRASELASTVKVPGAQGALILAVTLSEGMTLDCVGGQVLGSSLNNGTRTTLMRITESGLKLLRITGNGLAQLNVSVAGDLNNDGAVDALDAQLIKDLRPPSSVLRPPSSGSQHRLPCQPCANGRHPAHPQDPH